MAFDFLIYGAYGYTGELVARAAAARGMRPLLAGRHAAKIAELSSELGLQGRVVDLDDPGALDDLLGESKLVLHCAGPYAFTYRQMVEACLRTGTHYLDVTGEITVLEGLAALGPEAESRGVMILPGLGFDVVPGDCLAVHLKDRMPSADRLTIAFQVRGRPSRGTARTSLYRADQSGMIRAEGRLQRVPSAFKSRQIDFGAGPRLAVTIPWGDVSTAYHSSGIGNIETYMAMPRLLHWFLIANRRLGWILGSRPVQRLLFGMTSLMPPGPDEDQRRRGRTRFWGEVADLEGRKCASLLRGPDGYAMTVHTTLAGVERILRGDVHPGFQTPAKAFGPEFIFSVPGVEREDIQDHAV